MKSDGFAGATRRRLVGGGGGAMSRCLSEGSRTVMALSGPML